MNIFRYLFFLSVLLLFGCTIFSSNNDGQYQIDVNASHDININDQGNYLPLYVRVLQLSDDRYIINSSFYDLQADPQLQLEQQIIAQQSFILRPNQTDTIDITVRPETQYVAIIGDYANISEKNWKIILEKREISGRKPLMLSFNVQGIQRAQDVVPQIAEPEEVEVEAEDSCENNGARTIFFSRCRTEVVS